MTPVAFLMGIPWEDCTIVGELIGIKTVLNEFVAFTDLSTYKENRLNGTQPYISVRLATLATFTCIKEVFIVERTFPYQTYS